MRSQQNLPKMKMDSRLKAALWVCGILIVCFFLLPIIAYFGILGVIKGIGAQNAMRFRVCTTDMYRWQPYRGALVGFVEGCEFPDRLLIPAELENEDYQRELRYVYNLTSAQDAWSITSRQIYFPYTLVDISVQFDTTGDLFVPSEAYGNSYGNYLRLHRETVAFGESKAHCYVANAHYQSFLTSWLQEVNEAYDYCVPANVTYRFGYDAAPNDGIYFIDNLEETGKLISPPEPERADYRFAGWFANEALTVPWDFARDELEIESAEGEPVYRENCFYAAWTELPTE